MPRTKYLTPPQQKDIEEDLRERYGGGMMTAIDVGRELGIKDHTSYEAWLSDVPYYIVNNRKRWRVADIAKKMYNCMQPVN